MRFKALADLERAAPWEIALASLPDEVLMTDYAKAKAFLVSELVRRVHGEAFEWYGFTLADRARPELIVDLGLPLHDENQETYVSLSPEGIAAFQEALPADMVINGWLHSHGSLEFRQFSGTDDANQATVLDYVTSLLKVPVAKKEVVIRDLALMVLADEDSQNLAPDQALGHLDHEGNVRLAPGGLGDERPPCPAPGSIYDEKAARRSAGDLTALAAGSVTLLTDVPVRRAKLLETVYGGFCYAIVIGDEGWTRQEIHYKTRGVLTGETHTSHQAADLVIAETGRILTPSDLESLETEVKERLRPVTYIPEKLERGVGGT